MDENEARALGQGLAEGLGSALAGALDSTFGPAAQERARKAEEEKEHLQELADMQEDAIASCRSSWKAKRNAVVRCAVNGVDEYCASLRGCVSYAAEYGDLLPANLNYLERYNALRKMQDRKLLLDRINKTIADAESIAEKTPQYDPPTFFADCANRFRESVSLIGSVKVSEADAGEKTDGAKQRADSLVAALATSNKAALDNYSNAMGSLLSQIDSMFADRLAANPLSQLPKHDASDDDEWEELDRFLEEVTADVDKQLAASCAASAQTVAGTTVPLDNLPVFEGKVPCELRFDPGEVKAVAEEVRKAFSKYQRVVTENGVFAAFSDGSDFGKCKERYAWCRNAWWWDGESTSSVVRDGIASTIEEDDVEGGDSPARCLEKLRKANAKRYMGILDDDFSFHVDAFWYGFRKLMEFSTGLLDVDVKEFQTYIAALQETAEVRTKAIAVLMDKGQAEDFAKRVIKLEKTPWAGVRVAGE